MKILIVDDEWVICELLKTRLEKAGFEVDFAVNENEFRAKAFQSTPDLMILDIMLGDTNGVELYEQFLQEGFPEMVPVIFLSALARGLREDHMVPGRRYALYGKPFDANKLVGEISELVHA